MTTTYGTCRNDFLKRSVLKPIVREKIIEDHTLLHVLNSALPHNTLKYAFALFLSIILIAVITYFKNSIETLNIDYEKLSNFSLLHQEKEKIPRAFRS